MSSQNDMKVPLTNEVEPEKKSIFRRLFLKPLPLSIFLLFSFTFFGALAFCLIEGSSQRRNNETVTWTYGNSVYFTVVTLTTIGYGDFSPSTVAGKLLLVFYAPLGISTVAWTLGVIAEFVADLFRNISDLLERKPRLRFLNRYKLWFAFLAYLAITCILAAIFINFETADGVPFGYLNALYFWILTLVTLGFGDVVVGTTAGKVMVIIFGTLGLSIVSLFIGELGSRVAEKARKKSLKSLDNENNSNYDKKMIELATKSINRSLKMIDELKVEEGRRKALEDTYALMRRYLKNKPNLEEDQNSS